MVHHAGPATPATAGYDTSARWGTFSKMNARGRRRVRNRVTSKKSAPRRSRMLEGTRVAHRTPHQEEAGGREGRRFNKIQKKSA